MGLDDRVGRRGQPEPITAMPRHSSVATRGRRTAASPGDAQPESREAEGGRRATALIGRETPGLPRFDQAHGLVGTIALAYPNVAAPIIALQTTGYRRPACVRRCGAGGDECATTVVAIRCDGQASAPGVARPGAEARSAAQAARPSMVRWISARSWTRSAPRSRMTRAASPEESRTSPSRMCSGPT